VEALQEVDLERGKKLTKKDFHYLMKIKTYLYGTGFQGHILDGHFFEEYELLLHSHLFQLHLGKVGDARGGFVVFPQFSRQLLPSEDVFEGGPDIIAGGSLLNIRRKHFH